MFSSASKIHFLDAPNMVNWSIMTPCASTEGEAASSCLISNHKLRSLEPLFGKNAKIYPNTLNFVPHIDWKLPVNALVF